MMDSKHQNILGRRIFRQSLLVALVMTVVLSFFQVWLDYQRLIGVVNSTFEQIEAVQAEGLATALWNYSTPEIETITAGLINYPYISYAEIREKDRVLSSAGIKLNNNFIESLIPLNFVKNGNPINVGTLYIQADKNMLYQSIALNIARILFYQAIFVMVLTFIFLVMIDRQITRYLHTAVNILQSYDISTLENPLDLKKKFSNDEIDRLMGAFNDLRLRLATSNKLQFETERKHSTLLENLPGMAYRCKNDTEWTMELVSAGCYDLTGYQPEDLIENRVLSYNDLIIPGDREYVWDTIQMQIRESLAFEITYQIKTKSGQIRWVWERGVGVFSEKHKLIAIEGFITDVTEKKQQERDLEAIASVSYAVRSVDTRESILPILLQQITNLLKADGALIELIDPTNDDSVVVAGSGLYEQFVGFHIPSNEGLNQYIRKSGKPYLNNNVSADPIYEGLAIKTDQPASSGVPMITQGKLIGFLWIGRNTPISEKAVKTLSSIADIAANAIHRVDLFHQTQQRLDQLVGLRKIDTAINSNLDLTYTLDIFLEQVIELLHVDAVRVLKYDTNSKMITHLENKGFQTTVTFTPHILDANSSMGKSILSLATTQINDTNKAEILPETRALVDAEGFQSFFVTPLIVKNELQGLLQVFLRKPFWPDTDWIRFFETMAGQAAIAVNESLLWTNLQQSNLELQIAYDETLEGWSNALDLRDHETENHTRRVIELTLRLAEMMGIYGEELVNIRRGALLHDMGKIGIPDSILTKPGKLTPDEWDKMKQHPTFAYNLLYPIAYLRQSLDIPYCHHEKWDGSGYPRGLKGEEIPLAARIFALADVWDAMTSDRYYRAAISPEEVTEFILQNSGKHFDPDVVEKFLKMKK